MKPVALQNVLTIPSFWREYFRKIFDEKLLIRNYTINPLQMFCEFMLRFRDTLKKMSVVKDF